MAAGGEVLALGKDALVIVDIVLPTVLSPGDGVSGYMWFLRDARYWILTDSGWEIARHILFIQVLSALGEGENGSNGSSIPMTGKCLHHCRPADSDIPAMSKSISIFSRGVAWTLPHLPVTNLKGLVTNCSSSSSPAMAALSVKLRENRGWES